MRRHTVGLVLAAAACARPQPSADTADGGERRTPAAVVQSPDSAAFASAMSTLSAFLDASREGSATRSELVRLSACAGSGETRAAGPMLADYELLSPLARADTVIGRAVVTTVAEQDVDRRHPGYFIARVRVRADTLEWDVVPTADGSWVVCNGLSFGLTAHDTLIAWRPEGASRAAARLLADSIRATRASRAATTDP